MAEPELQPTEPIEEPVDETPDTIAEAAQEEMDIPLEQGTDGEGEMTAHGMVKQQPLVNEMQNSYLDYAMSVIVARALPDVRDGMKPVHRRILYAMWNDTGVRPGTKYKKSAAVVGDVLKSYHPHGDVAVYDTLVRMAQDFSMRYPLVDGQGNFGSVDGDSPAAMRYTESRMTHIAGEMLSDIEKETVNFVDNYDGSTTEPSVLPAKVPNLLINGQQGIAVGMATSIPPHNLGEVCDATIALIDKPEATIDDLMEHVKGPDFPTAAVMYGGDDVKNAYATGRGKVVVRAVAEILEKKNGHSIIVSEIPYQVNKSDLIEKMADLVKLKKLEGISDIRDESDRKDGVRIVIELKSSAFPKKILNRLYEMTAMQTTTHFNMLALVDGIQPRILTLKEILQEFIKHRQEIVRRRTEYDLRKAKERAHILEGLIIALDNIDEVIKVIRGSETRPIAHAALMKRFGLSDLQSTAILEMRLQTLVGLERAKIEDELREKLAIIKDLEDILAKPERILAIIKEELAYIKEKYGNARRTKVINSSLKAFRAEDLIPNEQVIVTLTRGNYIKRVPVETYRSQGRGGKGVIGMETKEEDVVDHLVTTWTLHDIMLFTNKGRIFSAKVYDLPAASRTSKGTAMVNVLQIGADEKVTSFLTFDPKEKTAAKYFIMATRRGVVKKTEIAAYANVRKTGMIAIKLNTGDQLNWVKTSTGKDAVMMISRDGQAIQFPEADIRPMGRSAAGVRGMKLRNDDEVMSMDVISSEPVISGDVRKRVVEPDLLVVLENGLGKKTPISNFRDQSRGGVGIKAAKVTDKTGRLVEAMISYGDIGDIIIMSVHGQVIRLPLKSVKRLGRDTQGVTLMRLPKGDKVSSVSLTTKSENADVESGTPSVEAPAEQAVAEAPESRDG
jgi:DNA gyrase subunit A